MREGDTIEGHDSRGIGRQDWEGDLMQELPRELHRNAGRMNRSMCARASACSASNMPAEE